MIDPTIIAAKFAEFINKHVGCTFEDNGPNRSTVIDEFNTRAGVPMGSSYCLTGAMCVLQDACKELHVLDTLGIHPGTQQWYDAVPAKYIFTRGRKGMIAIFMHHKDPDRGHAAVVIADQSIGSDLFETIEFNTDDKGSRDGDGCYRKTRSIARGADLIFRGFVDVCQWLADDEAKNESEGLQ